MNIQLRNVTKIYKKSNPHEKALNRINLDIHLQEKILISGDSGSGKTTLINILSLMDLDFTGTYLLNGISIHDMKSKELSNYRRDLFSVIHQEYALIEDENVYDNVKIPLLFSSVKSVEHKKAIEYVLEKVGLTEFKNRRVDKLSGGQRQRVAIARSLVRKSKVLLADEPLAAIQQELSQELFEVIYNNSETLIYVSHHLECLKNYQFREIILNEGLIEKV